MVLEKLSKLNVHKTPGVDMVNGYVLHKCAAQLAQPLCIFFNKSIRHGVVPDLWKLANVTSLFKKVVDSSQRTIGAYH
jgi:hypothetical protein